MLTPLLKTIRSGDFCTRDRVRAYSLISLCIMFIAVSWLVLRSDNNLSTDGKPLGTDFANVYVAGLTSHSGNPAEIWDPRIHYRDQDTFFGKDLDAYFAWLYPPFFLFLASALAFLPYLWALAVWQAASFATYLLALRKIAGHIRSWWLPAISFPAIYVNLTHGHNGFLSATLIGMGLYFLDKRPWLAGVFIGMLAYKPQFGLLIPLALLAGQHYRTIGSAGLTVVALSAASTLAYGPDIWPAFFESLTYTRQVFLEQGDTGFFKIQSCFSALMNVTGNLMFSYIVHGLLAVAVLGVVLLAFVRKVALEDRAALLITGSLLATPYLFDYDLIILAPALAFLAARGLRDGFRPYEVLVISVAWFAPLLTRPLMMNTDIPLGFLSTFALFCIPALAVLQSAGTWPLRRLAGAGKIG